MAGKRRQASSRLDNYPFEIYGKKSVDGKWRFVVKVPNHNHPPSPPEVHPMHRYLDETQFEYFMKSQPWKEHPMQILFL